MMVLETTTTTQTTMMTTMRATRRGRDDDKWRVDVVDFAVVAIPVSSLWFLLNLEERDPTFHLIVLLLPFALVFAVDMLPDFASTLVVDFATTTL
jgi:hypothetical protein